MRHTAGLGRRNGATGSVSINNESLPASCTNGTRWETDRLMLSVARLLAGHTAIVSNGAARARLVCMYPAIGARKQRHGFDDVRCVIPTKDSVVYEGIEKLNRRKQVEKQFCRNYTRTFFDFLLGVAFPNWSGSR